MREGKGYENRIDGKQYIGELKNGKYEGNGRYISPDDTEYEGVFKDDKPVDGVIKFS